MISVKGNTSESINDLSLDGFAGVIESINMGNVSMERFAPPFILALGTFGNLMIIIMFSKQNSASSLNLFFKALAVSDLCLLYTGLFPWWIKTVSSFDLLVTHTVMCKLLTALFHTAGVLSVWLLVAMTVQRAVSVVWPHKVNMLCTPRNAKYYLLGITIFFILINSHFLFGKILRQNGNSSNAQCTLNYDSAEYNFFMYKVWSWIDTLMYSLLPCVILIVSNSVLVRKVSESVRNARVTLAQGQSDQLRSREKKASSLTVTLVAISLAFFLLSTPLSLLFIIAPYTSLDITVNPLGVAVLNFMYVLLNLFWYINSALNFYLYCLTGTKFRNDFRLLLCCRNEQSSVLSLNTQISETYTSKVQNETEF